MIRAMISLRWYRRNLAPDRRARILCPNFLFIRARRSYTSHDASHRPSGHNFAVISCESYATYECSFMKESIRLLQFHLRMIPFLVGGGLGRYKAHDWWKLRVPVVTKIANLWRRQSYVVQEWFSNVFWHDCLWTKHGLIEEEGEHVKVCNTSSW